ncbi:MAG TPA: helix-turn-helix transcriptional regulator [Nevskiaceae bacterium]|nr:helix-turn-helix transcriptional regulator [Nevskiaceae bacterium]
MSAISPYDWYQPLTPCELRIVRLLALGYSNKEIATRVHISESGVKFHLKNVFGKLGARRRTHAVAIATTLGITVTGPAKSPASP